MKTFLGAVALALVAAGWAQAASVTIDFTGVTQDAPYSEDGYTFTPVNISGAGFEVENGILTNSLLMVGESGEFTKDDGGLFTLTSFMLGSPFNGLRTDEFQLLGFRDGSEVASFGPFGTESGTPVLFDISSSEPLDVLRIVGVGIKYVAPLWDNFVFTTYEVSGEVPVPASLPLLGAGLGVLGLSRRRRKTVA